jgi:hypothetical protein
LSEDDNQKAERGNTFKKYVRNDLAAARITSYAESIESFIDDQAF